MIAVRVAPIQLIAQACQQSIDEFKLRINTCRPTCQLLVIGSISRYVLQNLT